MIYFEPDFRYAVRLRMVQDQDLELRVFPQNVGDFLQGAIRLGLDSVAVHNDDRGSLCALNVTSRLHSTYHYAPPNFAPD